MSSTDLLKTLVKVQDRLETMKDQTSFVDFDLLNEEIYGQFEPFGMMGKDQVIGLRMMPPGGRKKVMYGIEDRKLVELDVVKPGQFIGWPDNYTSDSNLLEEGCLRDGTWLVRSWPEARGCG